MKTILMIMIVAAAMMAHAQATPPWNVQVNWHSDELENENGIPDIYGPDGVPVPPTSDWHAQILDALTYTVYVDLDHEGDGQGYGFWDFNSDWAPHGVAYQYVTLPVAANRRPIFTRIYNHRYPAQATMFADAGYTNISWESEGGPPPTPKYYNFGTVSQSDWKIIPEPGAAGLLLVGAGALVFRRMKARAAG